MDLSLGRALFFVDHDHLATMFSLLLLSQGQGV